MSWMATLFGLEILLVLIVLIIARKYYSNFAGEYKEEFQLYHLAPISLYLFDKLKLFEKYPQILATVHYRMISLYGNRSAIPLSKLCIAQMGSLSILLFIICTGFGAIADDDMLFLVYGFVMIALVPVVTVKHLDRRIKQRKQQMLLLLPEFLNKVILLVNAGENVQNAIIRCAEEPGRHKNANHPLHRELHTLAAQLKNNYSFSLALEELSKRCSMMEVTIFTTTVLLNYRRGGEDFVLALRNLSRELWEKRKAMSRTLGEEASSKLVFPMVFIFLIVMVIVAAPAILLMNE